MAALHNGVRLFLCKVFCYKSNDLYICTIKCLINNRNMGFFGAIKSCFSKYATFSGRARRSEYWWFVLLNLILSFIPIVNIIWGLIVFIPGIAVCVRRLHDTGRSGWWLLLAFVPLVNLVVIYFYICDSQPGVNQYGENPKGF